MSTLADTNRLHNMLICPLTDDVESDIYNLLGIDGPGAYIAQANDGSICVWASESESEDDDGAKATFRSHGPLEQIALARLDKLAWIDCVESI
jgi:hypothetical protein